jgi:hypothetical protein
MAEVTKSDLLTNQDRFSDVINNNPYYFNVILNSSDGRVQQLKIGSINTLVIQDSITNPFHQGYLILNNTFDAVERITDLQDNDRTSNNTSGRFTSNRGFIFKGDSRDFLEIEIIPKLNESELSTKFDRANSDLLFRLYFLFSIYRTEEIEGDQPGQKFKKLYFWDTHYELLTEKNSYFSTANFVDKSKTDNILNLDDDERGINTGTAIKEFLNNFFNSEGETVTFNENFDAGSTSIFFASPARYKGIDCLNYLISRHVSSEKDNYDMGLLELERSTNRFSLKSLKSYFQSAVTPPVNNSLQTGGGELYLETFKLGLYSDDTKNYFIQPANFTPQLALFLDKYGTINNLIYDPMPGIHSQQKIASTNVHSYNYINKQFSIDSEKNDINHITDTYIDNYVKPFDSVSESGAFSNFFPGKNRQEQRNIKNIFSVIEDEADQRLSLGRNRVIYNNIFFNNTVIFKVPGSTHRQTGYFIGIDRDGAISYSDFDSKMLGIYFVIEVNHIFKGNEYFTELRCVKTYSFNNLFLNNNSI